MSERLAWAEMLLPLAIGLMIAGSGGWTSERWAWGLTVMGYGPAMKMRGRASYQEGFWTLNPALREHPMYEPEGLEKDKEGDEETDYDRDMADSRRNPALTAEERNPSMGRQW